MYRQLLLFLIILGAISAGHSQSLGLRAPNTKLYQIETDTVQVIFAEGQQALAERVVALTHRMARTFPITGNDRLKKIPIILQGATDISNGYVGLGPWRSEFYLSPPQNSFQLGSLPWLDLLTIHEFRHVQQRSAGHRGLSKIAAILFGQEAYSGILNLSWPNWYTEGDAVIAETVLTNQGRGRLPSFLNGYRERILGGDYWGYEKARNGSFKERIPSHYPLGFLLQNYGRMQYGQTFWDSVVLESAAIRTIYPFSTAMKARTGLSTRQFYQEAMDYYRDLWQYEDVAITPARPMVSDARRYTDYRYPSFDETGSLLAVKTTFDRTAAIYRITNKEEEKIVSLGRTLEPQFSYANGRLCWTELRVHPRWVREDHSAIVVYDIEKKRRKTLTGRQSYFAPALSPDGSRIAALYASDDQQFELRILDSETGYILGKLPNPDDLYYSYPVWDGQDHIVSAARLPSGQMLLVRQSVIDGEIERLTTPSYDPIGRPYISDEWIYHTQSAGPADQLFRMDRRSGVVEQLTDGLESWYQPVIEPETDRVVAAKYSLSGNKLFGIDPDVFRSTAQTTDEPEFLHLETSDEPITAADVSWPVKPYSHWTRPVNIHSWNLFEEDPVYGIELLSENVLSSILWRNGFEYNNVDKSFGPFSELTIGVWYPEILLSYRGRRRKFVEQNRELRWFEHVFTGGLRVPFQSVGGIFTQSGSVFTGFSRISTTGDQDIAFQFLTHQLSFANRRIRAYQHPMTRLGQALRLRYVHAIDDATARQWLIQTDFSFPSPVRNHVLWLQLDYKRESSNNDFVFSDVFNYSRGYNRQPSDWVYRVGVNYQMPIVYPDFGVAGIVYFKRLRANPFFDFTRTSLEGVESEFKSIGVELMFDLELFNVEPVTVGWRWSHLLDGDPGEPTLVNRFGIFTPFERL